MNEIKLNKIEKFGQCGGVQLAHLSLQIANNSLKNEYILDFELSSTGTVLRIEGTHLASSLYILLDWLRKPSDNEENLRTNESEIILFARDMIKCNDKLKEIKTI